VSVDPQLDFTDIQSLNGYAYANNNPVTQSDPSGLCVKIDSASAPCLSATQSATPYYVNDQIGFFTDGHGNHVGGEGCGYYCGGGDRYSRPINDWQAAHWNGGEGGYDPYRHVQLQHHGPSRAQGHHGGCGFGCELSGIFRVSGDLAKSVIGTAINTSPIRWLQKLASKALGETVGNCANGNAGAGYGASSELCTWTTPSGQTGRTLTFGYGPSGPAGFGGGATFAVSNATHVGDLGGWFKTINGGVQTPWGGGQGSYSTGSSPLTGGSIWVAAVGASWGRGVNLQSLRTYTWVFDVH
jgi:hypothetical protein